MNSILFTFHSSSSPSSVVDSFKFECHLFSQSFLQVPILFPFLIFHFVSHLHLILFQLLFIFNIPHLGYVCHSHFIISVQHRVVGWCCKQIILMLFWWSKDTYSSQFFPANSFPHFMYLLQFLYHIAGVITCYSRP